MSRPAKPVRLDLLEERRSSTGRLKQPSVWIIRDGAKRVSTGCGPNEVEAAQRRLQDYLAERHKAEKPVMNKSAAETFIADAIEHYAAQADNVSRPKELAARLSRLVDWWGDRSLADVTGNACKEYVKSRGTKAGARRELEDLAAAIVLYCRDGFCRERVLVTLPEKPQAREAHFTRDEIARLVWFCLTYRTSQRGKKTKHRSLRHIVPFILTAVYTGTRSARVWNASYKQEPGRPWLDLENGIYYRIGDAERRFDNKRADPIPIPQRLLHHMRRWQQGPMVVDKATGETIRKPRRYLVEWQGRAADPKKGLVFAMNEVFGDGHKFVRHSFRHSCATWLLWEGVHSEEEIAAYLSMTVQILRKVYGHPHPDRHKAIADSFSRGRAGRRGHKYGRGGK